MKGDAFYNILTGRKKYIENNVLLTFDDGVESLWSTAYPILKKYGMVAISFIVTGRVREKSTYYPNLEEVWKGKATIDEIRNRGKRAPLCSWEEIKEMHSSGTIDFQSHTFYHNSVFISDKIIDFINPAMKTDFIRSSLNPVIRRNGHPGRFQSVDERYEEIRCDLFQSKMLIEEKLHKKVRHLSYPRYEGRE